MSSVINTNSLSLLTQNNLNKSQGALNSAIERLSSGMRINSAKDDSAGQAIANRLTATIKGLTQASRNASDGISMTQTTESSLGEVNNNLQRVRELTVQSANGSNSDVDRASMQAEITQRLDEINRLSRETDFNGTKVLSAGIDVKIQVGSKDGETINIALPKIDTETLGLTGFKVDGQSITANTAAKAADLAGFTKAAIVNENGSTTYTKSTPTTNLAATSATVFGKMSSNATVTAATVAPAQFGAAAGGVYQYDKTSDSFSYDVTAATKANIDTYLTPGVNGSTSATVVIDGGAKQEIKIDSAGNITAADDNTALYLSADGTLTKQQAAGGSTQATMSALSLSMSDTTGTGGTITAGGTVMTASTTAAEFAVSNANISSGDLKTLADATGYTATLGGVPADATVYTVATGTGAGGAVTSASVGAGNLRIDASSSNFTANGTSTVVTTYYEQANGKVNDGTGAQVYKQGNALTLEATTTSAIGATLDPLKKLDAALATVDNLRGALGAVQNRFDSTIANLGTTIVNLSSSRSRIEDADYAIEVSNMSRAQILQQAGTSVLAKANQTTEGVMSLLR